MNNLVAISYQTLTFFEKAAPSNCIFLSPLSSCFLQKSFQLLIFAKFY